VKVCSSETLVSTYKTSKYRNIAQHILKRGTGCGEWLASRLGSFIREENVLYQLNGSLSDVLWRGKCPASWGNQTPDCPLRTLVTVLTAKFYIASKNFRRRHYDDAKIIGKLRNEDLHPFFTKCHCIKLCRWSTCSCSPYSVGVTNRFGSAS
jgi:hypothetical protein